ncbi:unnamed protein product, partial [Choristocarpus tenellus]
TLNRFDISNAVMTVTRFSGNPGQRHWEAVKQILGYVSYTRGTGIAFDGKLGKRLEAFADADYASDLDQWSVSGGLICMGDVALSWFSRMQKVVALSTTEAEYVTLSDTAKEVLFLRQFLEFINLE